MYFEDGSFTRGPVSLPGKDVSGELVSFEFGIVAPGGRYCTRIVQTVHFQRDPIDGSDVIATEQNSRTGDCEMSVKLVRVTVSTEEWIGPARVYTEEKSLRELDKMERLCLRPSQTSVDFIGEWRSFNRLATPAANRNAQEDEEEEMVPKGSDGASNSFVFEGEVRFT